MSKNIFILITSSFTLFSVLCAFNTQPFEKYPKKCFAPYTHFMLVCGMLVGKTIDFQSHLLFQTFFSSFRFGCLLSHFLKISSVTKCDIKFRFQSVSKALFCGCNFFFIIVTIDIFLLLLLLLYLSLPLLVLLFILL